MWTCIRCRAEWGIPDAEPNVDDFGLHFKCPQCGRRNRLVSLGEDADGGLLLAQVGPPDPEPTRE